MHLEFRFRRNASVGSSGASLFIELHAAIALSFAKEDDLHCHVIPVAPAVWRGKGEQGAQGLFVASTESVADQMRGSVLVLDYEALILACWNAPLLLSQRRTLTSVAALILVLDWQLRFLAAEP